MPSMTRPNTTCFPSRKSHLAVVMKNWHPFVFGPEFACPHTVTVMVAVTVAVSMEGKYDRDADGKGRGWMWAYHGEQPGRGVLLLEVLVLPSEEKGVSWTHGRGMAGRGGGGAYGELVAVYREGARSVALEEVTPYTLRVRVDPPRPCHERTEAYLGT